MERPVEPRAAGSTSWNRRIYGPAKRGADGCGDCGADRTRSAGGVSDQRRRAAGSDAFTGLAVVVVGRRRHGQPTGITWDDEWMGTNIAETIITNQEKSSGGAEASWRDSCAALSTLGNNSRTP